METGNDLPPRRTILFVEDDHKAVGLLRDMSARKFPDIAVYVAENGEAGIEFCRKHHPDIVVTDINLPGIDGVRMAAEIKRGKPDTKFIVLTGYSDKTYQQQFHDIDIHDFLVKPVDLQKLFAAIQACIDAP